MNKVLYFAKLHWKTLAVAVGILMAYAIGRYYGLPPAKIVTVEKIVEKEVVVEKVVEKVVTQVVKEIEVQVKTHTVIVKESTPDGGVRETTVVDADSDTHAKEKEIQYVEKIVDRIVEKEVFIEKKVVIDNTKNWRAGLMAGIQPRLLPPTVDSYLLGLEIERRIVGPVWVGVWGLGNTNLSASLGVKIGVEF